MNFQKTSILPIALKYGFILTAVSFIISLSLTYGLISGVLPFPLFGAISFILSVIAMLVFVLFAYREFKAQSGGFMTFGEGFKLGTLLIFFSGVCGVLLSIFYFRFIDPEAQKTVTDMTLDFSMSLFEKGNIEMPPGFEEEQRAQVEKNQSPLYQFLYGAGGSLVIGAILSLIMAAIGKKVPKE